MLAYAEMQKMKTLLG